MSEALKKRSLTAHERAILATDEAAQDLQTPARLTALEQKVSGIENKVDAILTKDSGALGFWHTLNDTVSRAIANEVFLFFSAVVVVVSVGGFLLHTYIVQPSTDKKICSAQQAVVGNASTLRKTRVIVTLQTGEIISYDNACASLVTQDVPKEEPKK